MPQIPPFKFRANPRTLISADDVKKEITETTKRKVLCIPVDLKDPASAAKVVSAHVKEFGQIDILVNNASQQIMTKEIQDMEVR